MFNNFESFFDRDFIARVFVGQVFHPSLTVNNKTYRGDLHDMNMFFKAMCSTIAKPRPAACKHMNLFEDPKVILRRDRQAVLKKIKEFKSMRKQEQNVVLEKEINEYEKKKDTMEKRAEFAQIVLAFALVFINSIAIVLLCNWYYQQKKDTQMNDRVNAEVA